MSHSCPHDHSFKEPFVLHFVIPIKHFDSNILIQEHLKLEIFHLYFDKFVIIIKTQQIEKVYMMDTV